MPRWVCGRCGAVTPGRQILARDAAMRERLEAAQRIAASGAVAEAAGLLDELINSALQRCHPNHAIVVEARLGLVAWCAQAGSGDLKPHRDALRAAQLAQPAVRDLDSPEAGQTLLRQGRVHVAGGVPRGKRVAGQTLLGRADAALAALQQALLSADGKLNSS